MQENEFRFSQKTLTMKSSMIRKLVATTKGVPGLISLAGGFPSPLTFPKAELAELYGDVIVNDGEDILQYGSSDGDHHLMDELRKLEAPLPLDNAEVLITSGATNGIYLYAGTFIDEGDVILVEAPSFLGSLVAFEATGATLYGVEMDEQGMRLDALQAAIDRAKTAGKTIKFCYIIPEFQNPTGISTSLERRRAILALAAEHGFGVLEDNPYGYLRYEGTPIPSLLHIARQEMGREDIVTQVRSFSKILGPGMRMAYAVGPRAVIAKMCSWQEKVNVSVDCVAQRAVARFLQRGMLMPQVQRICAHYRPLLHTMLSALERHMPPEVTWTRPEGGMFLWVCLPEGMNSEKLFEAAVPHKVAFLPGTPFYPAGEECPHTMRLNFSYPTAEQIEEGVKRLAMLIREAMNR